MAAASNSAAKAPRGFDPDNFMSFTKLSTLQSTVATVAKNGNFLKLSGVPSLVAKTTVAFTRKGGNGKDDASAPRITLRVGADEGQALLSYIESSILPAINEYRNKTSTSSAEGGEETPRKTKKSKLGAITMSEIGTPLSPDKFSNEGGFLFNVTLPRAFKKLLIVVGDSFHEGTLDEVANKAEVDAYFFFSLSQSQRDGKFYLTAYANHMFVEYLDSKEVGEVADENVYTFRGKVVTKS